MRNILVSLFFLLIRSFTRNELLKLTKNFHLSSALIHYCVLRISSQLYRLPDMDTSVSTQFDRVVFQATREIFVGEKAKTKKVKGVKRCISDHPGDRRSVLQLLTQHDASTVHQSILRLLSDKVYESKLIASQRFPDLFESSVAQSEARTLLEEQATRTEQPAVEGILQTYGDDSQENSEWIEATTALNGK